MKTSIVIPTCKTPYEIAPVVCIVEGYFLGGEVISSCLKESASVNRNYCLDMATGDVIVMIDDDIAGFYDGWWQDLVEPLEDPGVIITSARLYKPDGSIGAMMFAGDVEAAGITDVPRVPTAAIAFRKTDIRFYEKYILSGFEDDHFCAEMQERFPGGRIVINNQCRLIHVNEQKGQAAGWEHNKKIFDSIWETSCDNTVRTRKRVYFSEDGEDRWLEENIFKGKTNGVFFECGAIDGLICSNTAFFERHRGWSGLCVEPNPARYADLKRNRSCATDNCALSDKIETADLMVIEGMLTGWGGLTGAFHEKHSAKIKSKISAENKHCVPVKCSTLDAVLKKHALQKIDLFILDIEGGEKRVLSDFPFKEYDIDVAMIENNYDDPKIDDIMELAGYQKIHRIGVNGIWRCP